MANPISIFWFRRDLRLDDNAALSLALSSGRPVLPIFIFDPHILNSLARDDARVTFIHATLAAIRTQLETQYGSALAFYHGKPLDVFQRIFHSFQVAAIYANHDYEPYARARDEALRKWLQSQSVDFHTCKDQVIFEKNEISKTDGRPYTLYTPYQHKWRSVHDHTKLVNYSVEITGMIQQTTLPIFHLRTLAFAVQALPFRPTG